MSDRFTSRACVRARCVLVRLTISLQLSISHFQSHEVPHEFELPLNTQVPPMNVHAPRLGPVMVPVMHDDGAVFDGPLCGSLHQPQFVWNWQFEQPFKSVV
jgi:hypothetical protein